MDPLSATVDFFDYFNAKYGNLEYTPPKPKTFTHSELQTMNHGSLWRGCIVLPTSGSGLYTLENTGEINGSMDKMYKAIQHSSS